MLLVHLGRAPDMRMHIVRVLESMSLCADFEDINVGDIFRLLRIHEPKMRYKTGKALASR